MPRGPGHPRRLALDDYIGEKTVSFDACTWDRTKLFTSHEVVDPLVAYLRQATDEHGCMVPIYCFMPDHLHVMLSGLHSQANARAAMARFKDLTGKWMFRRNLAGWQGNFYDHIMRNSDDWRKHATYIALNPVRAGLVADLFGYPFIGSIGCDLKDVVLPWE